jgi:2'-5' RNA ligase
MLVWVGIDLDSQYSLVKEVTKAVEEEVGIENSNFTLPMHVSLKISFSVGEKDFQSAEDSITAIYNGTEPFEIAVKGIELHDNICWIRMEESPCLNALSEELNYTLRDKFGVPLHEYDLDFKFHTTLFMDDDTEKVAKAYEKVKDVPVPDKLIARRFVIGTSESGMLGTYKIYKTIEK